MLNVYLDYPTSSVSFHHDPACTAIRMHAKPDQRVCRIDVESISEELQRFREQRYRFGSSNQTSDMWIEIEVGDRAFEEAIARYVHRLLGEQYRPFAKSSIRVHC